MSESSPTRLVIFDCDGVLVDSETICNEVLAEVVTELGWPMTLEEALDRFKGLAIGDIWARVGEQRGSPISDEENVRFRTRQLAALRARVRAVPGIVELLDSLAVPCCVASNGPPEKMEATLGATGLLPRFAGRMFSVTEVARPKPHPDLFLHAAERMSEPPDTTLVVEDSPMGVRAALSAGMRVVGFAGTITADADVLRRAGARSVITDIRDVGRFL